jgi:hypothetical protein
MKMDSAINNLLFSTVRIEAQLVDDKSVGTGFAVIYQHKEKQYPFIVTNKHVIQKSTDASFFFTRADGKTPIIGSRFTIFMDNIEKNWYFNPDEDVDIAITPLAPILEKIDKLDEKIFFQSIPLSLIPTKEQEEDFSALEEIIFIGYPSGIYDTRNLLPIIRKGTSATPISIDYEGKPAFLIDASVFKGSSGSPVFIYNEGAYTTNKGLCIGTRIHLLGILSSVLILNEKKAIDFDEIPSSQTSFIKTEQMLDLGCVIKSSKINETIEILLKDVGEI